MACSITELAKEGREWLTLLLPYLFTWLLPSPIKSKKKEQTVVALALFSLMPWGCSTVNQSLSVDKVYRADIGITINGAQHPGVVSVPAAKKYELEIKAPADIDYFTLRTCHREITSENLHNPTKYTYFPQWPIETTACPVEIDVLNRKGKHAFGLLLIGEEGKTLPAKQLKCNGEANFNTGGVSACQAATGLMQYIEFETEVYFSDAGSLKCELPELPKDGKVFQFAIHSGICSYTFTEVAKPHRSHRMYTRGYDGIILLKD